MSIQLATKALRDALCGLEPGLYSGEDAAVLAEDLATTEKVVASARAAMAARAAECGAHRGKGHASASEWMARLTGKTAGEARREFETTAALDGLSPETKADVAEGTLSLAEAEEIAKTEQACPGTETEMRDTVKAKGLRGGREKGRRLRQKAMDIEELERKRRDTRQFSHWEDELGMKSGREAPASVRARGSEPAHPRGHSRRLGGRAPAGRRSSCECPEGGLASRTHTVGGRRPPPHDGVDIQHVKRLGRKPSIEMLVALGLGDPPDFDGAVCADCGDRAWLDNDHVDPYAHCKETAFPNLKPRCRGKKCHDEKTKRDREAGLLGPDPPDPP